MKSRYDNEMELQFVSKSRNEAFARITVAAFAAQLDPTIEELADIKTAVSEAVTNCIVHAYEDTEGIVKLRATLLDNVLEIEISDNGKGIEAKDLGKIFERFYRTDASRNSSQGGSGIGLSIVKKIIEDHGGYIWATSKVGEGTCMHFVIRKYKEMGENENE